MDVKLAQTLLSDLLLQCESEELANLADDPLATVTAALESIHQSVDPQMLQPRMEMALKLMRERFGGNPEQQAVPSIGGPNASGPSATTTQPQPVSPAKGNDTSKRPRGRPKSLVPRISRVPLKTPKEHSPIEDVLAVPVKRYENRPLVEAFVHLGEYEVSNGMAQRGMARIRAAKTLRDADQVITSGAQAKKLAGIGSTAATKIDVILRDGLDGVMREYEQGNSA